MNLLSSLTNRIFLASALLAVLSIGLAIYVVNVRVTDEAEKELRRGLDEAGTLVEQRETTLVETSTLHARLIADLPKLKAAVDLSDPPTVQPLATDYHHQLESDLFVVTSRAGQVLAAIGRSGVADSAIAELPAIRAALQGRESSAFWPHPDRVLQVVTVPISIDRVRPEILGTLSVGFLLDNELAKEFKNLTASEIAFALEGQIRATTLPQLHQQELSTVLNGDRVSRVWLGGEEYVALVQPLTPPRQPGAGAARAIILRSRTERLRFLNTIHQALAVTALLAVLLATLLSYAVARTVTRPLAAITDAMREMAATGDLTRKILLRHAGNWDDEDARLLASTFNTLTDSIERFQREAAQRERLSSLGRLSTVVAHEIRNPLMIIKASLRTMRREGAAPHEVREAVADIDGEVARLNRVVNDVLDFARPIRFEYAPADLNALAADAAAAVAAGGVGPGVRLATDPALPIVVTDAERLRIALVNILENARQAVAVKAPVAAGSAAAARAAPAGPPASARLSESPDRHVSDDTATEIELQTERLGADRVAIVVTDRGVGIDPADLPRVFDPYFTTKRSGTGLGLPIAKNIIEGLGGAIGVRSGPEGTEIRIELPERMT